jgi:hypothetical protein
MNSPYSTKTSHNNASDSRFGKAADTIKPVATTPTQRPMIRVGRSGSDDGSNRMFDYDKAQVEILHSVADDRLAASMYGGLKRTKKSKSKKKQLKEQKKTKSGTSGYDFGF